MFHTYIVVSWLLFKLASDYLQCYVPTSLSLKVPQLYLAGISADEKLVYTLSNNLIDM